MYENSNLIVTIPYESDQSKIGRLESENTQLQIELTVERKRRFEVESELNKLKDDYNNLLIKIQKKSERKVKTEPIQYSEFKRDGKRKARAAESIRSYEDFYAIQQYFLNKDAIRDWMLWTMGVSLGLRISDLLSLKFKHFLNNDGTFRKRIYVIEKKTHKANQCLITESVQNAICKYLESCDYQYELDDFIFKSRKGGGKMTEEYGWLIISNAGKALDLPIVIGSHTMRKSFANIAACVDKSTVDMNSITKIQGLLNHSDQKVTMKYLGTFMDMYDNARKAVSDFVMGKTDVHTISVGDTHTIDDIAEMLERLIATAEGGMQ